MEREETLYFAFNNPKNKKLIQCVLAHTYQGGTLRFCSPTDPRIDFYLSGGHHKEFAAMLRAWADQIEGRPIAQVKAEMDAGSRPAGRQITLDDLPVGNPAEAWRLIYLRFKDHPHQAVRDLADDAAAMYQTLTTGGNAAAKGAKAIAATVDSASQLDLDLQTVLPHAPDLLKDDGTVIYGGQTQIGELLGVKNAGSGHERIKAIVNWLESEYTERRAA